MDLQETIYNHVGKNCSWCDETIQQGDRYSAYVNLPYHVECGVRSVMGSVACQKRLCPNCGDDPTITKREAARAAYMFHMLMKNAN